MIRFVLASSVFKYMCIFLINFLKALLDFLSLFKVKRDIKLETILCLSLSLEVGEIYYSTQSYNGTSQ
jgi:hypothetical protein